MIDKINGHIKLTNSVKLKPNSTFELIESQKLGEVQETRDIGNDYKWLDIKNIQINEKYFIMSLCFKQEKLSELSILISDNPFDLNSSWDNWSEKEEKEKLIKYQEWLNKELDKENEFNWGTAWASYDQNNCSTSIGIRYK